LLRQILSRNDGSRIINKSTSPSDAPIALAVA
jgi:hypothetical protein